MQRTLEYSGLMELGIIKGSISVMVAWDYWGQSAGKLVGRNYEQGTLWPLRIWREQKSND